MSLRLPPGAPSSGAIVPSIFTNEMFLRSAVGPDWGRVKVCLIAGDPEKQGRGAWQGYPADQMLKTPHEHLNAYFSVGVQTGSSRGLAGFERIFAIVLDDVGVKVDLSRAETIMGTSPSYVIETSPGNYQAGWFTDIRSRDWALGLVTALYAALGHRGDNLKNLVGYMRLPVGTNRKAKVVAQVGPAGFRHRPAVWNPGVRISTLDWVAIEARIGGVTPVAKTLGATPRGMPDPGDIEDDAVLAAFRVLGRVQGLGRPTTMGWGFDVDCPWIGEHTDRATEGAAYVPVLGRFHCHHGHCQDKTMEDVRVRLDELLHEDPYKTCLAALEFDEIELTTLPYQTAVGQRQGPLAPLASYEVSEDGAVQAFADRHGTELRFDHLLGCWFRWTGGFWRRDEAQHAFRMVCDLAREFRLAQVGLSAGQARVMARTAFAAAIERAARAHRAFAVDGAGWDLDPWRLGTPGGEVNLETGEFEIADPAHAITRQTLVSPAAMPTPVWDQFLWDSTGGDMELIGFLQAWCGYCLTGDTSEEKFVFVWGPGGTGKSTFIETINMILGSYAATTEADVFMQRRHDAHPEEVARLAGVRAVTASEIEDGRAFNVTRLKNFTGRDKLTGRFMRQNTFEFVPCFKITFVGNSQPRLTETGDTIGRRLVLVPFTQKPKTIDITLKDRLVAERPGILAWMIEGEIRRKTAGGLLALMPAAATEATREYLADQDNITTWANERLVFDPQLEIGSTEAYEDYKTWCYEQDEQLPATGVKQFIRKLLERYPDLQRARTSTQRRLVGATLV